MARLSDHDLVRPEDKSLDEAVFVLILFVVFMLASLGLLCMGVGCLEF